MARIKVPNACSRCRRQKLKCDVERPCTLCARAGVECVSSDPQIWRTQDPERILKKTRKTGTPVGSSRVSKRVRTTAPVEHTTGTASQDGARDGVVLTAYNASGGSEEARLPPDNRWAGSSGTRTLVDEAFLHHDAVSPETLDTSALGYTQTPRDLVSDNDRPRPASSRSGDNQASLSHSAAANLTSTLPDEAISIILVDNYFDKIHWFMLLFHQREFRRSFGSLYDNTSGDAQPRNHQSRTAGFTSVLLAVCVLSLRYLSPGQESQLADLGVDPKALREQILATIKLNLLDILSLGSLEAVQMCVLLGSYYLYHGQPELAWPVCGCALRLAQALELHRRPRLGTDDASQRDLEARKRVWWAVHDIETFCSMTYGLPLSISDADCDAEPLNPHDPCSIAADEQSSGSSGPNLLAYKCSMLALSQIVRSALQDLYGSGQALDRHPGGTRPRSRLRWIIERITDLDTRLFQWHYSLPEKLRLGRLAESVLQEQEPTIHVTSPLEARNLSSDFSELLFKQQALALKLAFENTRILIHRPLLSYKSVEPSDSDSGTEAQASRNPFRAATHACRDAALQISWAGQTPIFADASSTYALSFISLHLLTAGVTLCIMTSLDPLSRESFESKLGIRRLMKMQTTLRPKSIIADQGLQLLTRLLSLVMKKETDAMLEFGSGEAGAPPAPSSKMRSSRASPDKHPAVPENANDFAPGQNPEQMEGFNAMDNISPGGVETPFNAVDGSMLSFDFTEDQEMTQVMLDIEQVMGYSTAGDPSQSNTPYGLDASESDPLLIVHDPGWIWGPANDFGF